MIHKKRKGKEKAIARKIQYLIIDKHFKALERRNKATTHTYLRIGLIEKYGF